MFMYATGDGIVAVSTSVSINKDAKPDLVMHMGMYQNTTQYVAAIEKFDYSNYRKDETKLNFTVINNNPYYTDSEIQEMANGYLNNGLKLLDIYLKSSLKFGLKELGARYF